jgi:hypothetical protein
MVELSKHAAAHAEAAVWAYARRLEAAAGWVEPGGDTLELASADLLQLVHRAGPTGREVGDPSPFAEPHGLRAVLETVC